MKKQIQLHNISFSLTSEIQLEKRELAFLQQMAKHCIETKMRGSGGCEKLNDLISSLGIKSTDYSGPVYGLFE